jgi:hypothetical protein
MPPRTVIKEKAAKPDGLYARAGRSETVAQLDLAGADSSNQTRPTVPVLHWPNQYDSVGSANGKALRTDEQVTSLRHPMASAMYRRPMSRTSQGAPRRPF